MLDFLTDYSNLISLFIGIILAAVLFPPTIRLQYKYNQVVKHVKADLGAGVSDVNSLWLKIQPPDKKNMTPNMGGVVIWIGLVAGYFILDALNFLPDEFTTPKIALPFLVFSFLYGLVGFLDVLITNLIKENLSLREFQERFEIRLIRFTISVIPALVGFGIYLYWGIDSFNTASILPLLLPFLVLSITMHFAVYSAELTDGLDGLMIGIYLVILITLFAIIFTTGDQDNKKWLPILAFTIGMVLVDLYLNKAPAKFYNGGPSTMPLGALAFFVAYEIGEIPAYLIVSSITWIIMFSSMLQILSMKLFKRRIFKIAPLHHHFQALGWSEAKVTYTFWGYTFITAVIAILAGAF